MCPVSGLYFKEIGATKRYTCSPTCAFCIIRFYLFVYFDPNRGGYVFGIAPQLQNQLMTLNNKLLVFLVLRKTTVMNEYQEEVWQLLCRGKTLRLCVRHDGKASHIVQWFIRVKNVSNESWMCSEQTFDPVQL